MAKRQAGVGHNGLGKGGKVMMALAVMLLEMAWF